MEYREINQIQTLKRLDIKITIENENMREKNCIHTTVTCASGCESNI